MFLILVLGCGEVPPPSSGTAVGNPGTIGATASDVPEDITLDVATLTVFSVVLSDCAGTIETTEPLGPVDLLAPNELAALPGGPLCRVELEIDDITLEGETDGGTHFTVTLAPPTLILEGDLTVDGSMLLVELPLMIDVEALEALGDEVTVEADDSLAVALADSLPGAATLWLDDGDGVLTAEDTLVQSIPHMADASADEASGCTTAPIPPGWLLGLLLLGLGRRQRSGCHQR